MNYLDYISHYYWDEAQGLNFTKARAIIDDLTSAQLQNDPYDPTYEDYVEALKTIEQFVQSEKMGRLEGYTFNVQDLVIAIVDNETDLGFAWSIIGRDPYELGLNLDTALGLWTTPQGRPQNMNKLRVP